MAMLRKEFQTIFREPKMIGLLFGSPILMLLLFGFAVNTDVADVRMGVMDHDRTPWSREFISRYTASNWFNFAGSPASDKDVDRWLDLGRAEMMLVIPAGFMRDLKAGRNVNVQVLLDGTDSNRAAVIISYAGAISGRWEMEVLQHRAGLLLAARHIAGASSAAFLPVRMNERALFNAELKSRNFFLPGVVAMLLSIVTIMLTAMSVVKERETGTMEQILVSPMRPSEFIIGKTLPFILIAFLDISVVAMLTVGLFNVPFRGSFFFLLGSGFCFLLSTLAMGLFISTISMTQQQAMLSTFLFFIPSILLSGFIFPVYAMPVPVQWITYANPMRWFIRMLRAIFLKGAGISVLWPDLAALLIIGGSLLGLSVRRLYRNLG